MQLSPISPVSSSYNFFQTLVAAMHSSSDKLPKTSLPTEIPGTFQEASQLLPPTTIYTQHGTIQKRPLGELLGYA